MMQENRSSVLSHPSLLVDALLVLVIVLGLWTLFGWLNAPAEPVGTFSMQLIPDDVAPAVQPTANQDVLSVEQHSQLTLR